jgi:hypothetical protein
MINLRPGDIAYSYIQFYIEQNGNDRIRWIPLYLNNLKITVCVGKNSSTPDLMITKYRVPTSIPTNLDKNIVVFNNNNSSIIYMCGIKYDILSIIFHLTQICGLIVQPLSLNKNNITFNKFKKEGSLALNKYNLSNSIPETVWLMIISNMTFDIKVPNSVSIDEF